MAEIIWTKKAEKDLISIHEFISIDSVFYANRFIKKIILLVEVLSEFPGSGRVVPENEDASIRELIEGNYRIFTSGMERIQSSFFAFIMPHEI
jgi:toxin ParE1/3/4